MTQLHVAGTGLRGSGYPNASQTLRILQRRLAWEVRDGSRWLPEGTTLWQLLGANRLRSLYVLSRLMVLNALEALRVLGDGSARKGWIYVPYPAVFLLWWMSWLPRRFRPRLVADAYVSLWDAAFRDRNAGARSGFASLLVRGFEARALRAADKVLVDTLANRDWFIREFGLDPARIRAIPLALGIEYGNGVAERPPTGLEGAQTVLFVGTLVPLHGIDVVAGAVRLLDAREARMLFEFVGDGQDRAPLARLAADLPAHRLRWERDWQSADAVIRRMRQADICLGVFGGDGKASRVLPFKIYLALAAGRPIITQCGYSLPEGVPPIPAVLVRPEPRELADALQALAADQSRRAELASAARSFFDAHLGPDALAAVWRELLAPESNASPPLP